MKVTGVLLAGGESGRFGEPKAFACYDGQPFYMSAIEASKSHVQQIVIISHPALTVRFKENVPYSTIEDEPGFQGKGPLAGLHSAMKNVPSDWYFVLPCDMPLIDETIVKRLIHLTVGEYEFDAIVPVSDGRLQPLAALYHRRTFSQLEGLLQRDVLKVKEFLNLIRVRNLSEEEINAKPALFQNINTQEDYRGLKGGKHDG